MKNYLDFKLSGSKVFPYFLLIFLAMIATYIVKIFALIEAPINPLAPIQFVSMGVTLGLVLVVLLVIFFIYRLFITAVSYKGEVLKFDGTYSEYLKINVKGILLSIITLGIYSCWFKKNLIDFYSRSTSHGNIRFKFNSSAIVLFTIITIYIIAICLFAVISVLVAKMVGQYIGMALLCLGIFAIVPPTIFMVYRWYINFSHGNKTAKLREGGCVCGCLFLLGQILLTFITLGLYYPAAMIRVYRYFANRIEIRNEEGVLESKMGCDATMGKDFIFIFAQMLLTMITFGIYYPWAMCAISERMITKTYIETI